MKWLTTLTILPWVALSLAGCASESPESTPADNESNHTHADGSTHQNHAQEEGHSHNEGPHDGTVVDWGGGEFHVEFTVNHDQQEAAVYTLGDDAKTPKPIDASEITLAIKDPELTITLTASPQEDDPEGKSSRFVGTHESLATVREYEGTISGVVDGTPYSGSFKEEAHDH